MRRSIAGYGAIASSNPVASRIGMKILSDGGSAFDAATAVAFALMVMEIGEVGVGGEAVIIFKLPTSAPIVLCGQGTAPTASNISALRQLGHEIAPSRGVAAAVVPGGFGAWLTLARDYGKCSLETILAPAIELAISGFELNLPSLSYLRKFKNDVSKWNDSVSLYYGPRPSPRVFRNEALGNFLKSMIRSTSSNISRDGAYTKAINAFYAGEVAEEIEKFSKQEYFNPQSGGFEAGFLQASDLNEWRPHYECPVSCRWKNYDVFKPGFWSQGPVLLETLVSLEMSCSKTDFHSDGFYHLLIESMKLAYSDRELWYGDSVTSLSKRDLLLSPGYARARLGLIEANASPHVRPGMTELTSLELPQYREQPTSHNNGSNGDTCHFDVVDKLGNLVSATLSGGWFWGSPVIPKLGFSLSTRLQMFWLQPNTASMLVPGHRPRTTLSPTIALCDDETQLAFGATGADKQDQLALQFLLHYESGHADMGNAVDFDWIEVCNWPESIHPRTAFPNFVRVAPTFSLEIIKGLVARGHKVNAEKYDSGIFLSAIKDDGRTLQACVRNTSQKSCALVA